MKKCIKYIFGRQFFKTCKKGLDRGLNFICKNNQNFFEKKVKVKNRLIIVFCILYLVFALCILSCMIQKHLFEENDGMIVLFAIGYFIFFKILNFFIISKFSNEDEKKIDRIFYVGFAIMVILLYFSGVLLKCQFISDMKNVDICARRYIEDGSYKNIYGLVPKEKFISMDYFTRYPNNHAIVLILTSIYRVVYLIFGFIPSKTIDIIGTVAVAITVLFVYKIAKRAFSPRIALSTFVMVFVFLPFYTYVPFCYTDLLSMPFLVMSIYMFIKAIDNKRNKMKCVEYLDSISMLYIGYAIKGNVMVTLVAYVMFLLMKKNWKQTVCFIITSVLCLTIFSSILSSMAIETQLFNPKREDAAKFPLTHWVMMGLKGSGKFDENDYIYTLKQENYDKKKAANLEVIQRRINEYGFVGMCEHIYNKLKYTWTDGTYHIRYHIYIPYDDDYQSVYRDFIVGKQRATKEEIKENPKEKEKLYKDCNNDMFYLMSNGYQLCIISLVIMALIAMLRNRKDDFMVLFLLLLFGITLFLLIWETRSRYLFNFTPILLMVSAKQMSDNSCIDKIVCLFKKKNQNNKEKKHKIQKSPYKK